MVWRLNNSRSTRGGEIDPDADAEDVGRSGQGVEAGDREQSEGIDELLVDGAGLDPGLYAAGQGVLRRFARHPRRASFVIRDSPALPSRIQRILGVPIYMI